MNVYILIKAIVLGWFIVEFEPLQAGLQKVRSKLNQEWFEYVVGVLTCWQCSAFWAGLVLTQDFFQAATASVIVYIFEIWKDK